MKSLEIHQEMLNDISDDYDKRVGEFIFDATEPAANQFEKAYENNDFVKEKLVIDNLNGDELESRINERTGITRRQATYSIGTLTAIGNGIINAGDLFETESGIQFESIETIEIVGVGSVDIKAIVAGATGNVPANRITFMPVTLDNIDSITNEQATYDGFDAESDADLLQRYYDRIQTPATSGNKYHYLNWAKEISGVGDARVVSLWNGDNTVKVIVIDASKQPASAELVEQVQNYIDPDSSGLGDGAAPIGAYCTVVSAIGLDIDISCTVTADEDVTDPIKDNVTRYLKEIAFQQDFVSYAQIGSIIINTDGVEDYTDLTVNGGIVNIAIENDEVAILGGVTIV